MLCLILFVVGHICYSVHDGLRDDGRKAVVAVILGNKVNEDGTLSERLSKRLEKGLELYRAGRVTELFVSGGLGREGFYEGDKMREWLVAHEVPDSVIMVDNGGSNTEATVCNAIARLDCRAEDIIVVSQYYHITRTKMLFRKRGFENVGSASPRYFELRDVYSLLREFVGYYYYLIFGDTR